MWSLGEDLSRLGQIKYICLFSCVKLGCSVLFVLFCCFFFFFFGLFQVFYCILCCMYGVSLTGDSFPVQAFQFWLWMYLQWGLFSLLPGSLISRMWKHPYRVVSVWFYQVSKGFYLLRNISLQLASWHHEGAHARNILIGIPNCRHVVFSSIHPKPGFPGGTVVKNLPANAGVAGDMVSIPGLGRFPGGRNGNLLQYTCLGNPMDRGA